MNATILFISSNREKPEFEKKIIETLLDNCSGLPIVGVTQKPVDLGPNSRNIVVGDVGASGFNFCRQVQIGVEAIPSGHFVIQAESDCLYPKDYFTFRPPRVDIAYRNTNQYVLKFKKGYFKKKSSTFAQIFGRDAYLARLNYIFGLKDSPKWNIEMFNFPKDYGVKFLEANEYFRTKKPCLSFKTGLGMRLHTVTKNEELQSIPLWGEANELRKKFHV